jgi:predicted metal-binding membrane protein
VPPEAAARGRGGPGPVERLIARERAIVAVALAALTALAWLWLVAAPPGMAPIAPGGMTMNGMAMAGMPADVWSAAYLLPAFAMWALMMVAMMLPSAAPMILLHARVARQPGGTGPAGTALFLITYLAVWALFSAVAALGQASLIAGGLADAMTLALGDRLVAAMLLLLAGLYQLSPAKRACLDQCRSPLSFIMRLSRPGLWGAVRLGIVHGLYCLGCCWALMVLLFAGGVMNLAWIAGLALVVLLEKTAPAWLPARPLIGAALIVAGAGLALWPV